MANPLPAPSHIGTVGIALKAGLPDDLKSDHHVPKCLFWDQLDPCKEVPPTGLEPVTR